MNESQLELKSSVISFAHYSATLFVVNRLRVEQLKHCPDYRLKKGKLQFAFYGLAEIRSCSTYSNSSTVELFSIKLDNFVIFP